MADSDGRRRQLAAALATYCAALAFILLVPSGQVPSSGAGFAADRFADLGAPDWIVEPARFEFLANALILVPVSALGSLIWPSTTWRDWTAYAFIGACTVECAQGLLLPDRTATFGDVVANTLGGLTGALAVAVLSRRRTAAGTPPTNPD